jgi:hypothetical protein
MFKVGEKSESVAADRDGSRGRILTPEATYEQTIHPDQDNTVLRLRRLGVMVEDSVLL